MKYKILFAKKVTTKQYENITFSYEVESDDGEIPAEYAKALVVEKVKGWIDAELRVMGLPPLQEAAT
jgi:hypothetical protein